jgi:1-phosphofructokinase family hexose kinase
MIVCVTACPSVDKLFITDRLREGAVHRPRELLQLPGGKGINVARAIGALGGKATVAGLLGGHAGRWLAEQLEAEGIPAHFAWAAIETRACLSVFDRERKRLTEFYESCGPVTATEWDSFARVVAASLPGSAWLVVAGALPPGAPPDGFARLVAAARGQGIRTAVDTHGAALGHALAATPDVVKVNAAEAAECLGVEITSLDQAIAAARGLRERAAEGGGEPVAIVTHGEEGAVLVGPDSTALRGRVALVAPYPVGSGDAFMAGLLVARERARPWPESFATALASATAHAEQPGVGRLDPARAADLREAVELAPGTVD